MMDFKDISRKITRTLFLSQSFVSAALITTGTVNSIVGAELSGKVAWAGLPVTVMLISAAFGAFSWGFINERMGRRNGLGIGLILGAAGGLLSGIGIWQRTYSIYLIGMGLFGFAQSAMQLGRFAAAEVNPEETRGKAIATVVLGGTVGSIAGPLLVGPAGVLATRFGQNELVGPYITALILFVIATGIIFIWLRPDPTTIAKELAFKDQKTQLTNKPSRTIPEILKQPGVIVAILAMVIGQAVMVMVMVITALHMKALTHPLTSISLVISAHTFGMYAFSIFSGRLTDRLGRETVIALGAGILILAGVTAGLSPNVLPIAVSLFLLGLGWNFCYVGGSTLLTDQLFPPERSRMQGVNDLLVGLASAVGSLGSGFVFAAVGFQIMGFVGAAFAVIPVVAVLWWNRQPIKLAAETL
ncbi:MAG: MFS transporter [Anaerolineales bacterium]|nr:MAG: MFS transporter [Anaerolineales bacterium]